DQAGERHRIQVTGASGGGDQLARTIHEMDRNGSGAFDQLVERLIDDSKVMFEQSPLRHRPTPGCAASVPETPGTSVYQMHSYQTADDPASADFPVASPNAEA